MFDFKIERIQKKKNTNEGSFLQTPFWCDFKARHGWKAMHFSVNAVYPDDDEDFCLNGVKIKPVRQMENFEISVLERSFMKELFSICYVPFMPALPFRCTDEEKIDMILSENSGDEENLLVVDEVPLTPEAQTIEFANFIRDLALCLKHFLPKNVLFIRFDPDCSFSSLEQREIFNYGMRIVSFSDALHLVKCRNDIQPPDTTLISLSESEEEILLRMHSKWRYNIRLSERKGVKIERYTGDDSDVEEKVDIFYSLMQETTARDGNSCHEKGYYLDLIRLSAEERKKNNDVPLVCLYIADSDGEKIASIIVLFSKTESVYLYGASGNRKRNLMPNHLLQWTAILDAKSYGSGVYDMYGLPPEGKNERHPMHGLYMFKSNFGGKNMHRTGSWDYPYKFFYRIFSAVENFRAFWHKGVIKKIHGR